MRYEGCVYRPPSEAYSLIIQVTIGCSHNQCTFCSMYKDKKFRIRSIDEIEKDLQMAREQYRQVKRIFLADGNALVLKMKDLEKILTKIKILFPECERVGLYSAPKDILRKKDEELKYLKDLGVGIAYLGVESGSDNILRHIQKGVSSEELIEAGQKMVASSIDLSVTIISGLGGEKDTKEHAIESAKVVSKIDPQYLGLLTLLIQPGTKMYEEVKNHTFKLLTPKQVLLETKEFIKNIQVSNCIFRSNHASNYVSLAGTLPNDQKKLVDQLKQGLKEHYSTKDEIFRRL